MSQTCASAPNKYLSQKMSGTYCNFEMQDLFGPKCKKVTTKGRSRTFERELQQSAASLVNEITQALHGETQEALVFNDRGAIESALYHALNSCGQEPLFEISFNIGRRRSRYEQPYLSTLPVYVWDEIELDEEIDTIEEEIARLQEQKELLKRSASATDSDESCAESPCASSNDEIEDVAVEEPTSLSSKRKSSTSSKDISERKRKRPKIQKKRSKFSPQIDIEVEFSISQSDFRDSSSSRSPSKNSAPSSSCNTPNSSPSKESFVSHAILHREVFKDEQILVIKPVIAAEAEEDEDIDILN
eukprot:TRINITY_DN13972_c0_g1_i1.p1 TRINITY_DN13972_c0_g1~~TRINITY_DN13972_c0_g1_i1.p1  ORF type:complete len:302 (+),score=48.85 TRINITY_DN13972_c0_g1_i1:234-1139(+)